MKIMFRFALAALLGAAAFAQTDAPPAEKPPAEVEQALRARVKEFYTMVQNHEFRKAETLMADDTKDYWYEGPKPEINRFEILDAQYSEHFTRAKVFTQCSQKIVTPNFPPGEFSLKIPTTWRFENGNWYLYVDQSKLLSPMGLEVKTTTGPPSGSASPIPKEFPVDASFVLGKVKADKEKVELSAGASQQISINNASLGHVKLELGYPLKGIEPKLDRTDVPGGEKAVLTLVAGKEPSAGTFYVRVMPTGEVIGVQVQVK